MRTSFQVLSMIWLVQFVALVLTAFGVMHFGGVPEQSMQLVLAVVMFVLLVQGVMIVAVLAMAGAVIRSRLVSPPVR